MVSIDEKWSKVHEALSDKLTAARKLDSENVDEELVRLSDELDELEVSESRKLSSMSQDDAPLFEEFRSAFQEISDWISRAEAKLGTNRESQERAIGQELNEWKPKIGNLRKMAEKLVQLFVNQKEDVEPEMANLDQRWDHIVREVEKRIKSNEAFRMVEVEEIKTTISHLSIPSEPVVTVTQPSPVVDPDEEIVTLIEDDYPHQSHNQTKIRFDMDAKESSSESLSGETIKAIAKDLKNPPQPLPKPRWYLEQRARGVAMPVSPEKVKITENMLPSPQRLIATVEKSTSSSAERHMPEKTLVMSASTTPSSTVDSPQSTIFGSLIDDEALAKENAAIDHLLAETELQLEEVARHVRGLSIVKDKEQLEYEAEVRSVLNKIDAALRKLDELDGEQDVKLRRDLIDMEGKVLDAEVPALISRGDTLILMAHRKDPDVGKLMQEQVSILRRSWQDFKARLDAKRTTLLETQAKLKQFKKETEQFKRWLSSAKVRLVRANHDAGVAKMFVIDIKNRQSEIDHINHLATQLQQQNALVGHEMSLNLINSDWSDIMEGAKPLMNAEITSQSKLSTTPGSPLMKSAPAEVATRMAKLLDALAAIDRQLDTQILGTERPCENLIAQGEALATVKNALDKLRPTLRQTDQDLDKLSGKLSMEYFEKLSNSNSQLHKDWDHVKFKYAQRQELWNRCKTLETDLESRKREMEVWIKNLNNDHSNQISNEDIESKGKMVADLTASCKEFMCKTSATEAMAQQTEVDKILRAWKEVLAQLTRERRATSGLCEKVDGISLLMSKNINVSDRKALHEMINKLSKIYEGIGDLRSQLCHRISTDQTKEVSLLKARTTIERLAVTIPRRVDLLKDKLKRLESMISKRDSVRAKVSDLSENLKRLHIIEDFAKQHVAIKSMNLTVANMQYEVNRVLNDFGGLEREVAANQFDVNPEVACQMQDLKEEWLLVSGKIRHLAASGQRISSPVFGLKKDHISNFHDSVSESVPNMTTTLTSSQSPCSISPTTCSQSSFQTDESQIEINDLASQVETELQEMLEEATKPVSVHEPSAIRKEVENQQQVMKRLENKREYLDSFASNGVKGKSEEDMQARIGVLREMCNVIKHRVISRKSECTAMASDSEQFSRKLNEIDSWLTRLDGIYQSTFPLGQTLDVLECQHQNTMDALKELSKYDHHIKLFMQVCERMNNLYSRDNTEEIIEARLKVDERHKKLVADFTKRRNEIQAVQNSFASYNKSVERFYDWLFDIEMTVEQLENDCETNYNTVLQRKVEDIKVKIF